MVDDAPSTDTSRSERVDAENERTGPAARDSTGEASDNTGVPNETAGGSATNDPVDDGLNALGEPDVRRAVIGNAGAFAGAGIGLGCIVFASLFRLVGADFSDPAAIADPTAIIQSVFAVSEVYLVLTAVAAVGVTNYVLLSGLIGVDSGTRFDTDVRAMTAAGVGSAIGASLLLIVLLIATATGFVALTSIAPSLGELGTAGIDGSAGAFPSGGATDPGAAGETGLSALEILGSLLALAVSGAVISVLSGVTGGVTAYVTRRYGLST